MIQKRVSEKQFYQSNQSNQDDYIRLLRRNIDILFYDHIMTIPGWLGMRASEGMLIAPSGERIRVSSASYYHLLEWLRRGIEMLRSTKQRKPFDNGQGDMMIRVYDEGNIYF